MTTDEIPPERSRQGEQLPEEERMRELLEETEYDTNLGIELARDARRLVAGELSEAEFHERHHDDVLEEFGVDDRPLETIREAADGFDPDAEHSRREMLKRSGMAAGALSLAAWGTVEGASAGGETDDASERISGTGGTADSVDADEGDVQWGMVIDLDRCDGCLGCVDACREENNWSRGANWMYVMAYEDDRREGEDYLVRPCQHCTNAPCEKVCPVEARHTREKDGLVLTDYDACIGCRYCQVSCPYGVNYFQWGEPETPDEEIDDDHVYDERGMAVDSRPPKGVMGKCTMCPTRQDDPERRGTVACMDACDDMGMRAIHFGDLNDPESRPNEYLRKRRETETGRKPGPGTTAEDIHHTSTKEGDVSTFRLLESQGTDPNVIYVGDEPGPNAQQVEGPVNYNQVHGTVDRRKDVLDQGAAANRRASNPDDGGESE